MLVNRKKNKNKKISASERLHSVRSAAPPRFPPVYPPGVPLPHSPMRLSGRCRGRDGTLLEGPAHTTWDKERLYTCVLIYSKYLSERKSVPNPSRQARVPVIKADLQSTTYQRNAFIPQYATPAAKTSTAPIRTPSAFSAESSALPLPAPFCFRFISASGVLPLPVYAPRPAGRCSAVVLWCFRVSG